MLSLQYHISLLKLAGQASDHLSCIWCPIFLQIVCFSNFLCINLLILISKAVNLQGLININVVSGIILWTAIPSRSIDQCRCLQTDNIYI